MHQYSEQFFQDLHEGSQRSAREIVPIIGELIQPRSVVDLGCGAGVWLLEFQAFGVKDIWGIDGSYVDTDALQIEPDRFQPADLTKPIRLDRGFDLVVSLEVAEHLPAECADMFVESLVRLGPVVLFSAAIPFQGGEHHVNEQWPEYWAERFIDKGYLPIDCIRPRVWANEHVEWWYAQNAILYVNSSYAENHPALKRELGKTNGARLSMVHPKKYLDTQTWMQSLCCAADEIADSIPVGASLILIDDGSFGPLGILGRTAIPFPETDGHYVGPPENDEAAIRELERLRQAGATFAVVAWPAFWWLEHYRNFASYLSSTYSCVIKNNRLALFDLNPNGGDDDD